MFVRRWSLFAALCLSGCQDPAPKVLAFSGPTMGSSYEIKYVGERQVPQVRAVVEAELAAFDLAFSNWREDSEIARFNRHASTEPFACSPRFAAVLQLALDVAAATDGAYDPTVKPLSALYRRAKRDPSAAPDEAALAAAKARVDFRAVTVREGSVRKQRSDVEIDLDGIVAGAAADSIAGRLTELGITSFFLQITGEILAHGEKAPGVPWLVGVVDPSSDIVGGELPLTSLPLVDRALCTSGDYRNAITVAGHRMHHVFDPRTGHSTDNGVVSASVLAESAAVADALGTALMVLGPERARAALPRLQRFGPLGMLLLRADGDGGWLQDRVGWPE
ncbi:MAG: FAD:protein FMN transferase [Planctomycetes bacterium]|nr:FAD:protein FMN transferase [Planctomycetota bacterium]MCB9887466.1 FAD:protein FMN transferase [Planctomycetota bacterium]